MLSHYYVIIGSGPAAIAAIDSIRKADKHHSIAMIWNEDCPPYSRLALPYYVNGKIPEVKLFWQDESKLRQKGVELYQGKLVQGLDAENKKVVFSDGSLMNYQKLLIATGACPLRFELPGIPGAELHTMWTLEEAYKLKASAGKCARAIVLGAGFIGVQAAQALQQQGIKVALVEMFSHILPRTLDQAGAALISAELEKHGIQVVAGRKVVGAQSISSGKKIYLDDGSELMTDLIVLAAGVRPNTEFLRGSKIEIRNGIVVNKRMETSLADIFAAGDVAEAENIAGGSSVAAIWPAAVEQGRVAGANMAGVTMDYQGNLAQNALKVFNFSVLTVGEIHAVNEDKVIVYTGDDYYHKLIIRKDSVVGVIHVNSGQSKTDIGIINSRIRQSAKCDAFMQQLTGGYNWGNVFCANVQFVGDRRLSQ